MKVEFDAEPTWPYPNEARPRMIAAKKIRDGKEVGLDIWFTPQEDCRWYTPGRPMIGVYCEFRKALSCDPSEEVDQSNHTLPFQMDQATLDILKTNFWSARDHMYRSQHAKP